MEIKNIIIYFTGTGNSLAVSKLLAAKIANSSIVSIIQLLRMSDETIDAETCGLVFPVYCQDVPDIMKRLLRSIKISERTYIYAIATHNGDVGYSHFTIDRLLRRRGQHLQAGFAILMPGNSITPHDYTNSAEETQRRIQAAVSCVDKIYNDVARRTKPPYVGCESLRKRFKGFRNMFRHKIIYKVPEKFWVNEACDHCGICTRICPENNIRVAADSIIWGKNCQMCLACIHWCPKQAIQNGKGTISRKRYHHPDIALADMLCHKENSTE